MEEILELLCVPAGYGFLIWSCEQGVVTHSVSYVEQGTS